MAGINTKICAVISAHNRVASTIKCISALVGQDSQGASGAFALDIVLVDDGCTDGTPEEVSKKFPDVVILPGSGTLYWNGAMRLGIEYAKNIGEYSHYLLLNDDTYLFGSAIRSLFETYSSAERVFGRSPIVVGTAKDPCTREISYGGFLCESRYCKLYFKRVGPSEVSEPLMKCDTFNGNVVLIPDAAMRQLENLDERFTHSMGDIDFGFRATGVGIPAIVAGGLVAECRTNNGGESWKVAGIGIRKRFSLLVGPKGLPPMEWFVFSRRHAGPFWIVFFIWPYLKFSVYVLREYLRKFFDLRARS